MSSAPQVRCPSRSDRTKHQKHSYSKEGVDAHRTHRKSVWGAAAHRGWPVDVQRQKACSAGGDSTRIPGPLRAVKRGEPGQTRDHNGCELSFTFIYPRARDLERNWAREMATSGGYFSRNFLMEI